MDKETVISARNTYNDIINKKKELIKIKDELMKLDKVKTIEKCLQVIEKEERKIPTDDEILRYSFYNIEKEESICNIYVFMGVYRRNKNKQFDDKVTDYNKADYFIYQNIEKMFSGKVVYQNEQKDFERENIIIKIDEDKDVREQFYRLQNIYFMEFIKDENISYEKVLRKLGQLL